jgi:large subunit ribosomal protein L23
MGEFHYADVLVAPIVSEKSNELMMTLNKYMFFIAPRATKHDVNRAVRERFGVEVVSVNIINLPRKPKRAGRHTYMTPKRRKAVVTLAQGQHIPELSEAV